MNRRKAKVNQILNKQKVNQERKMNLYNKMKNLNKIV